MGTGYTRNDTGNNISDGNVINAADLDGEFDAIVTAFGNSSGHDHDGTAANGAPITKFGPSQEVEGDATALFPAGDGVTDLGKSTKEWKDLYIDGVINTDDMSADTATMVSATITNNASVGGTFNVGGATTLTGAASLSNTLAVSADSAFKGAVSVESTLRVTGDTDVEDLSASGTFDVAGTTNLATAIITGTVNIVGETTLDDVSASGTLDVAGETNLATATITGNISADGTLDVSGNGSVGGTFNVEGDLKNSAGNLTIAATSYIVEVKGGGSTEGQIKLNCAANSHGQIIRSQPHSESISNEMLLPKGANSTLVSEVGTATITNKTLTSPTINGATIDSAVSVSAAGAVNVGGNASVGGTLAVTNTITGSSTISDQDGDLRDVSKSGATKSTTYTLADGDQGNFIQLSTATAVAIVPNAVFSTGEIVSVVNTGASTGEISCTITSAIIAGADASTATMTLGVNGVASILFLSNSGCIVTGNIS